MPGIRWVLLQARYKLGGQMKLKLKWSSFSLSLSSISQLYLFLGWLLFQLLLPKTKLPYSSHCGHGVPQVKDQKEHIRDGFSLLYNVERLITGESGLRLIHSHEWWLIWAVGWDCSWSLSASTHRHASYPCGCLGFLRAWWLGFVSMDCTIAR